MKTSKRLMQMVRMMGKPAPPGKPGESRPLLSISETLAKVQPTVWVVLYGYLMAALVSYLAHRFFLWCPPYLQEIVKNLRGLPYAWFADALIWLERGVIGVAFLSALYHNLWKLGTTYKLTDHDLQVSQWFPIRMRQSVPYGAVRRLGSKQGLLGALLDYGHVEVDTGGSVPLVLVNCPRPQKFVETLQHKVEEVLQPQLLQNRS